MSIFLNFRRKKKKKNLTWERLVPPERIKFAKRKNTKFGEKARAKEPMKIWRNARIITVWRTFGENC